MKDKGACISSIRTPFADLNRTDSTTRLLLRGRCMTARSLSVTVAAETHLLARRAASDAATDVGNLRRAGGISSGGLIEERVKRVDASMVGVGCGDERLSTTWRGRFSPAMIERVQSSRIRRSTSGRLRIRP